MDLMRRALALCLLLWIGAAADARIGGGESYSGSDDSPSYSSDDSDDSSDYSSGGSSSGGSSSGGGSADPAGVGMVLLFFVGMVVVSIAGNAVRGTNTSVTVTSAPPRQGPANMAALRRYDPNFSDIVFTDFCYSLFARLYEAHGRGQLDRLAPYVSPAVRDGLRRHGTSGLTAVDGIVIGSFTVVALRGLDRSHVEADVEFEANYTEVTQQGSRRWYVREVWTLTRLRDLLSPRPEKARAEHCPRCGAALETRTDGACLHCGTVITDGTFHWYLRSIRALSRDERPPRLGGSSGPEPGLDRPTVIQPWFARETQVFLRRHPDFTWEAFYARVREVAVELQNAWTGRDWHRARPYETDALFQSHRYWIDEYLRQGLRNVVDQYSIDNIEAVRVTSDAFYDAITVRLFATGRDYTVGADGRVVGGSPNARKSWSEYWTFIRGRAGAAAGTRVCPNCGGSLAEGQTAICAYCGGKIASGEFPWVLSRIEQDEAYRG